MAEIKFDVTRMQEVHNRLNDMGKQLQQSSRGACSNIRDFSSEIKGDGLKVINDYAAAITNLADLVNKTMNEIGSYLQQQIVFYSKTEDSAVGEIAQVQNILNSLE